MSLPLEERSFKDHSVLQSLSASVDLSSTATRPVNISAEIPVCNSQESKVLKVPFIPGNKVLEIKGNFSSLFGCLSLCSLLATAIRASEGVKQSAGCFSSSELQRAFCCAAGVGAGTHSPEHTHLAQMAVPSQKPFLTLRAKCSKEQGRSTSRVSTAGSSGTLCM